MPIYEYVCTDCGHDLEALQKISEQALVYCPQCGEPTLKKKLSAAAFRLKGTGWYETDFKESGKKTDKPAAGKESADTGKESKKPTSKETAGESATKGSSAPRDPS